MKDIKLETMKRVLELLAGKIGGFYLVGGTALTNFYFQHRESEDLDFFTKDFSAVRIRKIVADLSNTIGLDIKQVEQRQQKDKAQLVTYHLMIDANNYIKIDFVQDFFKLIKSPNIVNGISIASVEDIYLRKIYAVSGSFVVLNGAGKQDIAGGRQEAKDFFDLYHLSRTVMPLSKFVVKYCDLTQREGVIIWYRKYDRQHIKIGLSDIKTNRKINFVEMERYFKLEIDELIKQEIV